MTRERAKSPKPSAAERLLGLSEDDFRGVVDRDLRGRGDPETHEALRSPAVIDRTYNTCLRILKSIEGQFAAKRADIESSRATFQKRRRALESERLVAEHAGNKNEVARLDRELDKVAQEQANARSQDATWRAGAVRFKTGLEEDLVKLRDIRDSYRDRLYDTVVVAERNRLAVRTRELEQAIRSHQEHVCTDECDSERGCVADHDLWRLVNAEAEVNA